MKGGGLTNKIGCDRFLGSLVINSQNEGGILFSSREPSVNDMKIQGTTNSIMARRILRKKRDKNESSVF